MRSQSRNDKSDAVPGFSARRRLAFTLVAVALLAGGLDGGAALAQSPQAVTYVCPMHPDVTSS